MVAGKKRGRVRGSKNQKKQSCVSPSWLATHYEIAHRRAISGAMEDSDLLRLIAWEHAEIHGKAMQRVEVSGKDGQPIQAVINFGTKD